jgi:nicotinamidase/pyrazinamidase
MSYSMIFFDVDTQRDFMESTGALYVPDAETIHPLIGDLLRTAGERGITTISSRCSHQLDDPEFEIFPPHCIEASWGAERIFSDLPELPRIVIPVDARPDPNAVLEPATHYQIEKRVFDLFSNAWLAGLRKKGAFKDRKCVVFGVATDYCVRACVLGLASAGAQVMLVEDAVRGVSAESTRRSIEEMRDAGVEFISSEKLVGSRQ